MKTIAEIHKGKINNFTFLRLLSAAYVIFCHSWDLLRIPLPFSGFCMFLSVSCNLGVLVFFTISGFLVTESYIRHNDPYFYIKSRMLRIFPGLLFSLFITALCIGVIATSMPIKEYLTSKSVYAYIYHNVTLGQLQMALPGVFTMNPYPDAVNGSLWTLPLELRLYFIIGFIGFLGAFKKNYLSILFVILAISLFSYKYYQTHNMIALQAIFSFMIGSLFFLLRNVIRLNYIFLFTLMLLFLGVPSQYKSAIAIITLSYFVFLIAYSRVISLSFLDKYGDFSYGLYIFAFPIQQLLIQCVPGIHPGGLFLLSFLITLALSMASWFLVEKPALAWKRKAASKGTKAISLNAQVY